MDYLENNKLISVSQYGFRKGRSCVTQLLECTEEWLKHLDCNGEIDIIYLDFKAAFDKVSHKRLLAKMDAIGIKGKLLKWIDKI